LILEQRELLNATGRERKVARGDARMGVAVGYARERKERGAPPEGGAGCNKLFVSDQHVR